VREREVCEGVCVRTRAYVDRKKERGISLKYTCSKESLPENAVDERSAFSSLRI
jgi:hypothetical protein